MQSPAPRRNGESGSPLLGAAYSEEWVVAPIWTRIERKLDRLLLLVVLMPIVAILFVSYLLPVLFTWLFAILGALAP